MEEELFRADETVVQTEHEKILVSRLNGVRVGRQGSTSVRSFASMVDILIDMSRQGSDAVIEKTLQEMIPEYTPT